MAVGSASLDEATQAEEQTQVLPDISMSRAGGGREVGDTAVEVVGGWERRTLIQCGGSWTLERLNMFWRSFIVLGYGWEFGVPMCHLISWTTE